MSVMLAAGLSLAIPGFALSIEKQKDKYWCWASAVQSVLRRHGITASQLDVVSEAYVINATFAGLTPAELAKAYRNAHFSTLHYKRPLSKAETVQGLKNDVEILILPVEHSSAKAIVLRKIVNEEVLTGFDCASRTIRSFSYSELINRGWFETLIVKSPTVHLVRGPLNRRANLPAVINALASFGLKSHMTSIDEHFFEYLSPGKQFILSIIRKGAAHAVLIERTTPPNDLLLADPANGNVTALHISQLHQLGATNALSIE